MISRLVENWRRQAEHLLADVHVLYFLSRHSRTRWYTKCVAACPVAYLFSPIQLIPSFIPVIGFLDDFLVLLVAVKIVKRFTPPDLLQECRELAEASELGRLDPRPGAARSGSLRFAAWWLLTASLAGALVFAYAFHLW